MQCSRSNRIIAAGWHYRNPILIQNLLRLVVVIKTFDRLFCVALKLSHINSKLWIAVVCMKQTQPDFHDLEMCFFQRIQMVNGAFVTLVTNSVVNTENFVVLK